ncbi:unnamed protein product [Lactuca saligna]|uniref:Prolyl endopeptidase n=1 Tax=Lactuca saligna TaxID=75948 RepID=A0AA35VFL6_LACSI|nr:unnamed protein product [Lactuca saligna]
MAKFRHNNLNIKFVTELLFTSTLLHLQRLLKFTNPSPVAVLVKTDQKKYCTINGRSAGGLLIGAVVNMRPDLFKATVAGVPFVDVVTTMLGPTIPLTIAEWEEWGDPRKEEFYFYMKSYSPVDNGYHRLMQNLHRVQQVFANIMNRDITWTKIPEEMSYEAYDLINKLLTENPAQRLGFIGAVQVEMHHFFKNIHWDTLARQKATFIPSAETLDTSYFMSWLGDECGNLEEFGASTLNVNYSFNNFSFKVNALLSYLEIDNHEGLVREHMPGRYAELEQYWGESQVMGPGPRADGWADEFSQEHGGDPNAWALSFEQQHGANADDVCGPNGRSSTFTNNDWTLTRNGVEIKELGKGIKKDGISLADQIREVKNKKAEILMHHGLQYKFEIRKNEWKYFVHYLLLKLPRSPNVYDILAKYLEYMSKKDGMMTQMHLEI